MTSARPVPEADAGSVRLGEHWYFVIVRATEAMADRKAELDKKRKKLEELRKARELKKAEAKDKEVIWPAPDKFIHNYMYVHTCGVSHAC